MPPTSLADRVAQIEQRLAAIEDRLDLLLGPSHPLSVRGSIAEQPTPPAAPTAAPQVSETQPALSAPPDLTTIEAPAGPPTPEQHHPETIAAAEPPPPPAAIPSHPPTSPVAAALGPAAPPPVAPRGPIMSAVPRPGAGAQTPPPSRAMSLEALIGGRGLPIAGAIAFILGVGFLVALAVKDGWFGRLPPAAKCGSGAVLGVALLVGAGVVSRRINRWAASGINAAGLGALYVSAWAAWALYDLTPAPIAFVMLGGCAALGLAISVRSRLVAVGVVSLLGGYLAPLLVGERDASPLVMPTYLLSLLAVGLGLSWRLAGYFSALRTIALAATIALGTAWALSTSVASASIAIGFLAAVWAAFHAEMVASARRDDARRPLPFAATDDAEPRLVNRDLRQIDLAMALPIVSSFVLTAWAGALGVWLIARVGPASDWTVPGALCVAAVLVSLVLAGHLRFLIDRPGTRQERFGAALAVQAGGLVGATIALGIGGWMQLCAWVAVGAAAGVAAGWLRSRPLAWYGAILLAIASIRLVAIEALDPAMTGAGLPHLGLYLTRWALLAAACAAGWTLLASAAMLRGLPPSLRWLAAGAAGVSWMLVPVHDSASGASIGLAWLGMGVAGLFASRRWRALPLVVAALVVVSVASLLLVGAGKTSAAAATSLPVAGLVISKWTLAGIAACVAWVIAARTLQSRGTGWGLDLSVAAAGLATVSLALSVVHPDVEPASLCVAWLAMGVVVALLQPLAAWLMACRWAGALLLASLLAWLVAFVLPGDWTAHPWPLLTHPGLLWAIVLCAAGPAYAWWWNRFEPAIVTRSRAPAAAAWTSLGLAFVATSHEAARAAGVLAADPTAQAAILTLWWAAFASALLGVGFVRKWPSVRWAGLAVLGLAALKAVLYDMAGVGLGWRVVVFMALGAVMLCVAMVYARINRAGPREGENADKGEDAA